MYNTNRTHNSWSNLDHFLLVQIEEKRQGKSPMKKNKMVNFKQVPHQKKPSSIEIFFTAFASNLITKLF